MDKGYMNFIADLKKNIVRSRYITAKLITKEQLLLDFKTGKMLSEKTIAEKWGASVIERIAMDLQGELPGIRGFSYASLKNMQQFLRRPECSQLSERGRSVPNASCRLSAGAPSRTRPTV